MAIIGQTVVEGFILEKVAQIRLEYFVQYDEDSNNDEKGVKAEEDLFVGRKICNRLLNHADH